jgi:acetolactate decarboxylase
MSSGILVRILMQVTAFAACRGLAWATLDGMPRLPRFLGVLIAFLAGCTARGQTPPPYEPESSLPGVQAHGASFAMDTHGSLQMLMDHGRTDPVAALAPVKQNKTRIALGMLSALRGEFAIFEGEAWVAYPNDDGTFRSNELGANDETAAFMVSATVPEWQSLALREDARFDDLDDAIEKLGESAGLDVEQPFPFLIEGALVNLAFSVVNGRPFAGETRLSRDALMAAAAKAKYPSTQGTIVGFFSKRSRPEFLEPGSSLHLHVVLRADNQMGHVDRVDLPSGTSFRVPVPRR